MQLELSDIQAELLLDSLAAKIRAEEKEQIRVKYRGHAWMGRQAIIAECQAIEFEIRGLDKHVTVDHMEETQCKQCEEWIDIDNPSMCNSGGDSACSRCVPEEEW
jgi:hypothetical protein